MFTDSNTSSNATGSVVNNLTLAFTDKRSNKDNLESDSSDEDDDDDDNVNGDESDKIYWTVVVDTSRGVLGGKDYYMVIKANQPGLTNLPVKAYASSTLPEDLAKSKFELSEADLKDLQRRIDG